MSSSREESPDWLRCFKGPTSSTLVLSSDSEPYRDGSPSKEDRTESEELSSRTSPKGEDGDENLGKILGGTGAKSPSSKKSKSTVKGKKLEDDISSQKNKSEKVKKRKGMMRRL